MNTHLSAGRASLAPRWVVCLWAILAGTATVPVGIASRCEAQELVDSWRMTLEEPAADWSTPQFDDAAWKQAQGGFGTPETPGSRVGTNWETNQIWLRKQFNLDSIPEVPALLLHHDEDVEVFINGVRVAELPGFTAQYEVLRLSSVSQPALKVGENSMAVHCRQTRGGQFIDVHLIDANKVPELPKPLRDTKPFQSALITEWGAALTADNAWTEYPRPQLQREQWTSLNGMWDIAITDVGQQAAPSEWTDEILVPFCLESKLGGVQRLLDASEALWYRRQFEASKPEGNRVLLNFEAIDYRCEVFVNDTSVGQHVGGNTPFSLDVTDAIVNGSNELVVRVEDETEAWQLRGKQTLNARGIWYTQVSGIWQTVWMEQVPNSYIQDVKITTDASQGSINVRPELIGGGQFRVVISDGDQMVASGVGTEQVTLSLPNAKLWSPTTPNLYDIEVHLLDADGESIDRVTSYAGIRTVGKMQDADGNWRFTLNGQPIFHWGTLDQGWWPDGLLTPPSDEAMLFDIQWLKDAGFNMIRKHIKIEPRRYYYHCDRVGMMVWQDHVSAGHNPQWTRLVPNPADAQWPDDQHAQFMLELERMIDCLENHPSIVCWVPFNEAWGQHRTLETGKWTVNRDPSRLVNVASGGNFWPIGDVVDAHSYPNPEFPFDQAVMGDDSVDRFAGFIKVMGEFGGHGLPVQGHLWDANRRNWGYGDLPKTSAEYRERYVTSLEMLDVLRQQGIAAGVYTQTTDVEGEINGLMTYDRKAIKIPAEELFKLHQTLFN